MPSTIKTALFVDFDNVYGSLFEINPAAAEQFGAQPETWLKFFEAGAHAIPEDDTTPQRRSILARRCYLNPDGFVDRSKSRHAGNGETAKTVTQFRRYRRFFTRNGYSVVDCPRLTKGKNSADIVMVMDIIEMLRHPTPFDEFIILSADADFTPVLLRLREHDRRTTAFANVNAVASYRAASDVLVGEHDFIQRALVFPKLWGEPEPAKPAAPQPAAPVHAAPAPVEPAAAPGPYEAAQYAQALATVRRMLAGSPTPIMLSPLLLQIRREGGDIPRNKRFSTFLTHANDSNIRVLSTQPGWAFDPDRHSTDHIPQPQPKAPASESPPTEDPAEAAPPDAPDEPLANPPPTALPAETIPARSPMEVRVRSTIQACCIGMLEHETEPLSLKDLETGVAAAAQDDWLHLQGGVMLADLIASLEDPRLSLLQVGEGFIYDPARHDPFALCAPEYGEPPRLSRPLDALVQMVRPVTNCPALTPAQNRALFAAIAAEHGRGTFDLGTDWGLQAFRTAVADECASQGHRVPSAAVAYIVNALDGWGEWPEPADTGTPDLFAQAYADLLNKLCDENRVKLRADETTLLGAWIKGSA